LYLRPPDRAQVLCVDEKSQIQALDRTPPLLPMRPGQVERRTQDDTRHGTTSLFSALDAKTAMVIGQLHRHHRSVEFRKVQDTIDATVPADLAVHLILHTNQRVVAQRGALVRCPDREADQARGHASTRALEAAIRQYIAVTNEEAPAVRLDQIGR
jgi:hypothetical protein